MLFEFTVPEAREGIRVIERLPDLELGRLEGQNGIGKTMALRLLQLCTGDTSPYLQRRDSWKTLCEYIGPVRVRATGLHGIDGTSDHSLEWQLDLRPLADGVPERLRTEHFDTIELDGQPADLSVASELLAVMRIDGSEDIASTIAQLLGNDRRLIEQATTTAEDNQKRVASRLIELLELLPLGPSRRLVELHEQLENARDDLATARRQTQTLTEKRELLRGAAHAAFLVEEIGGADAQAISTELAELDQEVERLEARERGLTKALVDARTDQATRSAIAQELDAATRLHASRVKTLSRRTEAARELQEALNIRDEGHRSEQVDAVSRELEDVEHRIDAAHDALGVGPFTEQLRDLLDRARDDELGDRIVAVLPDRELTAVQLLGAVDRRREELAASPTGQLLDELTERREHLRGSLESLSELSTLFDRIETAAANLAETEEHLVDLRTRADLSEAERHEAEIAGELASVQRDLADRRGKHSAAAARRDQLGAGRAPEDLVNDRDRLLAELELEPADVDSHLTEAERGVIEAEKRRDDLELASAELHSAVEAEAATVQAPISHKDLAGVTSADALPSSDLSPLENAKRIVHLHSAAEIANQMNQRAVLRLRQVQSAVQSIEAFVRNGQPDKSDPEVARLRDHIRNHYESALVDPFSTEAVRRGVFEGGQLTRLNLSQRRFEWTTADGDERLRPFDAFSSGERAFAYTQARIFDIEPESSPNRLIAIDEFGAFLSTDRRRRLYSAIQHVLASGRATQVLLVLPLSIELAGGELPSDALEDEETFVEQRWFSAPIRGEAMG